MDYRERKILSPDLDIFGDDNESEQGTDAEGASEDSMDIFGGLGDQSTDTTEDATANETSETDADESAEGETQTETNTDSDGEKTEDEINFDKLFEELEAEAQSSGNNDLMAIIEELKNQNTDLLTENKIKDKQLEVLNEKLMGKTGEDTGLSMYKGLIEKLEANPKILMLAKFWGDGNDKIKQKMINILSDSLYELTGQDVSDLIDKSQTDKITAVTGGNASSEAPSFKQAKEDEEPMDYETSISSLF